MMIGVNSDWLAVARALIFKEECIPKGSSRDGVQSTGNGSIPKGSARDGRTWMGF